METFILTLSKQSNNSVILLFGVFFFIQNDIHLQPCTRCLSHEKSASVGSWFHEKSYTQTTMSTTVSSEHLLLKHGLHLFLLERVTISQYVKPLDTVDRQMGRQKERKKERMNRGYFNLNGEHLHHASLWIMQA